MIFELRLQTESKLLYILCPLRSNFETRVIVLMTTSRGVVCSEEDVHKREYKGIQRV
jgi:hypothetical protein